MCAHCCPCLRELVRTWELYTVKDSEETWTLLTGPRLKLIFIVIWLSHHAIFFKFYFAIWHIALVLFSVPFNCHVYIVETLHSYRNYSLFHYHLIRHQTYHVFYFFTCLIDYLSIVTYWLLQTYTFINSSLLAPDFPMGLSERKIWKYLFRAFWSFTRKWAGIAQLASDFQQQIFSTFWDSFFSQVTGLGFSWLNVHFYLL